MSFMKFMQYLLTRSTDGFKFSSDYSNKLNYFSEKNLGIYIHIPFCKSICNFCPYCKVLYNKELCENYIDYLLREIDLVCMGQKRKPITSIYFGGGSPALAVDYIGKILEKLDKYFILNNQIGIELHPSDVSYDNLAKLKNFGISKLSIGVQSFQDKFLGLLSRKSFDYLKMFEIINKFSFETVAVDFIFALDGQDFNDLKSDLDIAFANGANYAAFYPFIDFKYLDKNLSPSYSKKKRRMLYELIDYCNSMGYKQDSIWTFSKDGNSKYSSMTRDNYLGFGVSATTVLNDIFKINTFDIPSYIDRIDSNCLATSLTLEFTKRQRMLYYLFWTMYTTRVNFSDFYNFFNVDLKSVFGFEICLAKLLGFIYEKNNNLYLTKRGIFFYHYYECHYTYSYIDSMWNLLTVTPFPNELTI